jgi:hypothetical protein
MDVARLRVLLEQLRAARDVSEELRVTLDELARTTEELLAHREQLMASLKRSVRMPDERSPDSN